jgi:triacylglycerol lipase
MLYQMVRSFFMNPDHHLLANICKETYSLIRNSGDFHPPNGYRKISAFMGNAFEVDSWIGFMIEDDQSVIVAFRGTETQSEWIADAVALQTEFPYVNKSGKVHHGFISIYQSLRENVMDLYKGIDKNKKITITGHSLGAALATMHALDVGVNEQFSDLEMVNFASPKVGNRKFCSLFNKVVTNSMRYVNLQDIVPLLPPFVLTCPFSKTKGTFHHVKKKVTINIQENDFRDNHDMSAYIKYFEENKNNLQTDL